MGKACTRSLYMTSALILELCMLPGPYAHRITQFKRNKGSIDKLGSLFKSILRQQKDLRAETNNRISILRIVISFLEKWRC